MNKLDNYQTILMKLGFYAVIGYISYTIFHLQGFVGGYQSDTVDHVSRILPIVNGDYFLPHSMLHYTIYGIVKLCEILSIDTNLMLVMVQFQTILLLLVFELQNRILSYYLKTNFNSVTIHLISAALLFVISVYAPFFNKFMYLGQWSPNIWHNPTTFLLKPFALLGFFGMYHYIQGSSFTKNKLFVIGLSALLTISIWAKPSFVITFYPALFIYLFTVVR